MTSIPEQSRTVAALKVIAEVVKTQQGDEKAAFLKALQDLGVKGTVEAKLPDGTQIGSVTMCAGRSSAKVTDRAAFTKWVEENHPDQVTKPILTLVRPAFEMAVLKAAKDAKAPVDQNGEVVPGISVDEGEPYLTTTLADGAAQVVLSAIKSGTIQPLALPAGEA